MTRYGHGPTTSALRDAVRRARESLARTAGNAPAEARTARMPSWPGRRRAWQPPTAAGFVPVVNATGVVIHTNLGRAPLAARAVERIGEVARGYATLEYDLARGARGSRSVHAEGLLCALTGAEAAVVVNNNAAAMLLVLGTLARGREVLISRGELVEIGGGFRVPDVMTQSGASLREVGTTNRTRLSDFTAAMGPATALVLRVHPSNFRIEGFTEQPALAAVVAAAHEAGVAVVEDLGSGNVDADSPWEPTVQASLAAGVDLVAVSGDKMLGGPQAGIILGKKALVDRLRAHPLMRALRVDKLTYAALEGTLLEHHAGRAHHTVPVLRMLHASKAAVTARARRPGRGAAHPRLAVHRHRRRVRDWRRQRARSDGANLARAAGLARLERGPPGSVAARASHADHRADSGWQRGARPAHRRRGRRRRGRGCPNGTHAVTAG